jgi:phage shock protein C
MSVKKLYRSRKDKVIGGVCGGLGKYLKIDPVLLRILFVASIFLSGAGLILYVIAWLIMPLEPSENEESEVIDVETEPRKDDEKKEKTDPRLIFAGVLIIIGILLLLGNAFPLLFSWAFSIKTILGVLLVIVGGIMVMNFIKENR